VTVDEASQHPDFETFAVSWDLALGADGYAANTLDSYRRALTSLAAWLYGEDPAVGPVEMSREHVRAWIVHLRDTTSSGTARSWFAGVRHFSRWMVAEHERDTDPTEGIKTPRPNDVHTPMLKADEIRLLLRSCSGDGFRDRRDAAIIYVFVDGGLRLAELCGLEIASVDIRDRVLYVKGKGSNRSGPRLRAVPLGVKSTKAVDRYIRTRRQHPYAELPQLWLGDRGRPTLSADGIDAMLKRRGAAVGVKIHPHMLRHGWASAFRAAGGSEGDLMVLGGWRSRQMLDRYGKAAAEDRARDAYRKLSFGDRL
jgi:site-specific recombinase XerD